MNRAERRSLKRRIRKRGISEEKADEFVAAYNNADMIRKEGVGIVSPPKEILEGDIVTLDVERIKSRQNYEKMSPEYKQFVEENEGKFFTAHLERENTISLNEDGNKWLFWSGDLNKVECINNEG